MYFTNIINSVHYPVLCRMRDTLVLTMRFFQSKVFYILLTIACHQVAMTSNINPNIVNDSCKYARKLASEIVYSNYY